MSHDFWVIFMRHVVKVRLICNFSDQLKIRLHDYLYLTVLLSCAHFQVWILTVVHLFCQKLRLISGSEDVKLTWLDIVNIDLLINVFIITTSCNKCNHNWNKQANDSNRQENMFSWILIFSSPSRPILYTLYNMGLYFPMGTLRTYHLWYSRKSNVVNRGQW